MAALVLQGKHPQALAVCCESPRSAPFCTLQNTRAARTAVHSLVRPAWLPNKPTASLAVLMDLKVGCNIVNYLGSREFLHEFLTVAWPFSQNGWKPDEPTIGASFAW